MHLITNYNQVRAQMETLVREKGVNSFQMYMAYKDVYMLRDSELFQALQHCKDIGAVGRVHAENGELVAEVGKVYYRSHYNILVLFSPVLVTSQTLLAFLQGCQRSVGSGHQWTRRH